MRDGDERRSGLDEDDARSDLADVLQFRPGVRASSTTPGEPGLRVLLGEILRDERTSQDRTLADVAREAAISLPYLSEVERGRKEVSSDLLGAVCEALDLTLVQVLERCVGRLRTRAQGGSSIQMRAA